MDQIQRKKYDEGRGFYFWWQFVLYALVGQLCWNVENQYFNTYLYAHITKDVSYVTAMVIVSATLTCFSTFLFGTISDRRGKRKKLVGVGFIVWGITTIIFGTTQFMVNKTEISTIILAATMVVIFDGIMSFVGSIAYDCGFNVWVNDHTTKKNSGKIGWVLGVMPVIATILGTVVGGIIISTTKDDQGIGTNYQLLFGVMGGFVILCGVLALIFTKDKTGLKPHRDGSFWHQFSTPFNFKKLKKIPNIKEIILASLVIAIYFTSFNFYFVHLGNWAQYELGFSIDIFGYIEGIGMILGIIIAIPISKLITKKKIPIVCLIGLLASFIGLMLVYLFVNKNTVYAPEGMGLLDIFNPKNLILLIAVFFFGTGEILMTEACMIWIRGLFPNEVKGQFEGLRCVFFVWIPMFLGTICGDLIIKNTSEAIIDDSGLPVNIPNSSLFLGAAIVAVLAFIPLVFAWRKYKKRIQSETDKDDAKEVEDNEDERKIDYSSCKKEVVDKTNKTILREIIKPVDALDKNGSPILPGYSYRYLYRYNRASISVREARIKEWEFYQFNEGDIILQFTIGHASLFDNYSFNIFNTATGETHSYAKMKLHHKKKIVYPDPEKTHNIKYEDKNYYLEFINNNGNRLIKFKHQHKKDGLVTAEINITNNLKNEKMVILTPFKENPYQFYLNYKENYYQCRGVVKLGEKTLKFNKLTGLVDSGRGYWPYKQEWMWSSLTSKIKNDEFGWNLGCGFGDLSYASENMIFYKRKGYQLGALTFDIDYQNMATSNVVIKDKNNRFAAILKPVYDHYTHTDFIYIHNKCHQVHYLASGTFKINNQTHKFENVRCFLEHANNQW